MIRPPTETDRLARLLAGEPLLDVEPEEPPEDPVEREQLGAIRAYWDRRPLSQGEVTRLRLRTGTLGHAGARRPRRAVAPVALLTFALGVGTAFGMVGLAQRLQRVPAAPTATPVSSASASPQQMPARGALPPGEAPADARAPNASPSVAVPSGSIRAEAASSAERTRWRRALGALREDDAAAAEQALAELGKDDDAERRDTAQLALATLWLQQGRAERARPLLQQLERRGATPYVRARARELLSKR